MFDLLKNYLKYYYQQKDFWLHSLLLTLLMLIPFVNFYTVGYVIEVLKRSWLEPDSKVFPPMRPIYPFFINALWIMALSIIWALPLSFISVTSMIISGQDIASNSTFLFQIILLIIGMTLLFFLPAIIVRYEKNKSWKTFFQVPQLIQIISPVITLYSLLFILMCLSIFIMMSIAQIFGFLSPFLQLLIIRFGSISSFCFFYFLIGKALRGNFYDFLDTKQIETTAPSEGTDDSDDSNEKVPPQKTKAPSSRTKKVADQQDEPTVSQTEETTISEVDEPTPSEIEETTVSDDSELKTSQIDDNKEPTSSSTEGDEKTS